MASKSKIEGNCQMCNDILAMYKCPACGICTCSVPCINKHKNDTMCSGIRSKTEMIERQNMDNFTLLSDYRFLEEIDHKIEDGIRNPMRKKIVQKETFNELPPHLKMLKNQCKNRGTVIQFMPQHFTRHKENSTRYHIKEEKIRWHIKWEFPHADISFIDESVDEDKLIVDLLMKYLEPLERLENNGDVLSAEDSLKLCYYQSASYRRICVLLKADLCHFEERFIQMNLSRSLKDNLANRKVVEYPVFYVVFKDHLDSFLEDNEDNGIESLMEEVKEFKGTDEVSNEVSRGNNESSSSVQGCNREILNYFETFSDDSD